MLPFAAPAGTRLLDPIGSGSVFTAALVREGARVLVCKRLAPRVRREPAARAAIAREALVLERARHPALPELVRVGDDAQGPFVLETRAEGASARALVNHWRDRGGVPARLAAHLAAQASAALAELHALADAEGPLEITHGDLGPDHLLLGPLGDARFVDLGAARFRGMDPRLCTTADRGTLPFAPPEVARGERAPDQAADVYALAATLLFVALGAPIAEAQDDGALLLEIGDRGIRAELVDQAINLAPRAREALRRALAYDPAARLAHARDLAEALA